MQRLLAASQLAAEQGYLPLCSRQRRLNLAFFCGLNEVVLTLSSLTELYVCRHASLQRPAASLLTTTP
jgi:hypothetical protein